MMKLEKRLEVLKGYKIRPFGWIYGANILLKFDERRNIGYLVVSMSFDSLD
jgi:hypothetical protein